MGPLQYMVIAFEDSHFRRDILPEIQGLTEQRIVRLIDLVFVFRDNEGVVTSHELADFYSDKARLISEVKASDSIWFVQRDIDNVGASLPNDSAVVLVLLEHVWARHLERAIHEANHSLTKAVRPSRDIAGEIERMLTET